MRLELAYQEGVRATAQQEAALNGLRTRAGALLGAANIATAFLAGVALKDQKLVAESWVATLCFVTVAILTVSVLLPRKEWVFELDSRMLVDEWIDQQNLDLNEMHRHLARFLRSHYEANKAKMDRLFLQYVFAGLFLTLEIVAWLVDLGRGTTT